MLVEGDLEDQVKEELNQAELQNLVCQRDNAQIDEDDQAAHKIPASDDYYRKVLKDEFGHDDFREGQLKAVKVLLEQRRNVLVVLATGGGKSLCYQYASRFLPGLVLVVTPLISLMTD